MGDDTTTAPERIWAYRTDIVGAVETGVWADTIRHMGGVEYIRADLCPAPDAVARLVEAARAGLNYLENTEGEFGITLGSATDLRAALAAMEASHDRT